MTAGCIHGCAYCYIRGYSQYPGDEAVVVYQNIAEKVEAELKRKRKRPVAVYFCPSSDAFMCVDEVLEQSYKTMEILLNQNIGVQFVTKGVISSRFIKLFSRYPNLVSGQIGLTTCDDGLNSVIEPHASSAKQRLNDLKQLIDVGVKASLRVDPLIYGVTDLDEDLHQLFSNARLSGVGEATVSYLFLRPGIIGSLRRNIKDEKILKKILDPFNQSKKTMIRGSGTNSETLPVKVREKELGRVRSIAKEHGIEVRICGCKNSDITSSKCHLTNLTVAGESVKKSISSGCLF